MSEATPHITYSVDFTDFDKATDDLAQALSEAADNLAAKTLAAWQERALLSDKAIRRALELHRPYLHPGLFRGPKPTICQEDGREWPCSTVLALDPNDSYSRAADSKDV